MNTLKTLATLLSGLLKNDRSKLLTRAIKAASTSYNMPQLDESTYLDLYTWCSNLYLQATKAGLSKIDAEKLKTAARACMTALAQAVFANVKSSDLANATGLSIYFADPKYGMESSYPELYWSEQNPSWVTFLNNYLAKA